MGTPSSTLRQSGHRDSQLHPGVGRGHRDPQLHPGGFLAACLSPRGGYRFSQRWAVTSTRSVPRRMSCPAVGPSKAQRMVAMAKGLLALASLGTPSGTGGPPGVESAAARGTQGLP